MITLSKKALALNIGAVAMIGFAFISLVRSTFARAYVEPCPSRYHSQVNMRLDHDGVPLTASELQAVANGLDEGLLEHLTIAQFNDGPAKFAMGVKINKGSTQQRSAHGEPGGISLPWTPNSLEQLTAACLSYDVFLPTTFDFNTGGTLPGLFGTTANGRFGDMPHFGTNLSWAGGGEPRHYLETKAAENENAAAFKTYEQTLARGRWVHVDQEIILNTPEQSDGVARLWLDGRIESEVKKVYMRADAKMSIAGVAGEVYFGGSGSTGVATNDETIWLSPFQLRWN